MNKGLKNQVSPKRFRRTDGWIDVLNYRVFSPLKDKRKMHIVSLLIIFIDTDLNIPFAFS